MIGCIYNHPSVKQEKFDRYYFNNILEKFAVEKKTVFLSDFNMNSLGYEKDNPTFLDSLSSNMCFTYILPLTRISGKSKPLIIFSPASFQKKLLQEVSEQQSDHLPQFLINPDIFCNPPANKANIFNHENFILHYFDIDWPNILKIEMENVDFRFDNLYEAINAVLENPAPYQKF